MFLDEIGSMSLKMQAKLLKAIEERSFHPLGSDKAETSRFRVISATLEDVQSLIKAGKMRFDFFQRIHGLTVELLEAPLSVFVPSRKLLLRGQLHDLALARPELSDEGLRAAILELHGVELSRRSITQYRKELGVGAINRRKSQRRNIQPEKR